MEASSSHRLYRSWKMSPQQTHTNPSFSQSTVLLLTRYFKNSFPIFSAQEKPTERTTSAPVDIFCFNAWFRFFLLGFILSVLGDLMSAWSVLLWNFLPFPHTWRNTNSTAAEFLLKQVSFCLSPSIPSVSTWASCQCSPWIVLLWIFTVLTFIKGAAVRKGGICSVLD